MKNKPQQRHPAPQKGQREGSKKRAETFVGAISVNSKGTGFIENPTNKDAEDYEILPENLHTALHNDEVEARPLSKKSKFGRQLAEVVSIVKREKIRYAGVLESANKGFALVPD